MITAKMLYMAAEAEYQKIRNQAAKKYRKKVCPAREKVETIRGSERSGAEFQYMLFREKALQEYLEVYGPAASKFLKIQSSYFKTLPTRKG